MNHEEEKYICTACDSEIHLGRDVIRVQEGVMGTKGFVPLSEELYFCTEECLRKHFDDTELIKFDRRIP